MTKFHSILLLGIMLVGCKGASVQMTIPDNDTAKVLQVALRTAFFERKLPETGPLFAGNLFNDSILVDIDSFPKRLLPARLDTLKFKFGSYPQISALLSHIADSLKPNYLYICCFERTDSIYSVSVQSRSDAKFGGGGSMGIDIIKRADSFIVEHTYGNSIN